MAGIVGTNAFPKALWEGVKLWWDEAAKGTPEYAPMLFKKESSTKNYEEYVQEVGVGLVLVKPEGQAISYDTVQQGFEIGRVHV